MGDVYRMPAPREAPPPHSGPRRSAAPVACRDGARIRTGGFWPFVSRCTLAGPHLHQTCFVCNGTWTCNVHDASGC